MRGFDGASAHRQRRALTGAAAQRLYDADELKQERDLGVLTCRPIVG